MEIATETQPTVNTTVPDGVATTKQEADRVKRGKGRPTKPFISELPVPTKFEMNKPEMLFEYLRSIPEDKLKRIMLVFYRYLPVCDETENGTKDKYLEKIPGESHPFIDEDWEKQVLHRYGCGIYGAYLNEMNRTICRCLKIETKWDLDNYPPNIDPQWVDQDHPQNRAFIQYLRSRGVKLPTQKDKEDEASDMQLADTVSQLTGALIARTTPVPQVQQQPSMVEKLSFEMASSAIDIMKEKSKAEIADGSKQTDGLALVDKVLSAAEKMNPKSNGDEFMKMLIADRQDAQRARQSAEERHEKLMERMFDQRNNPTQQPKTLIEQMREMAEMRQLMQAAFGAGGSDGGGEAEEKAGKESIPEILIKSLPTLMQHGMGMWGQLNQTMAYRTRMMEIETLKATGQLPTGAAPVQQPQVQPMQAQTSTQQTQQTAGQPEQTNINPATSAPFTQAEIDAQREKQQKYAGYHGLIAMIAQPLITHLSDPGHVEDGELVKKDGYDFAEWFINGNGRLMYETVKAISPDDLMGAIESYAPLWQVIGGAGEKVKEFIGEFLTLDEFLADESKEKGEEQ